MDKADAAAAPARQRPEQWQRYGVIAAQGDKVRERASLPLDHFEALFQFSHGNLEVADIAQPMVRWPDPVRRVVPVDEHPAGMTQGVGTEAASGAVGRADVERNPGYDDSPIRVGIIVSTVLGAEETRRDGERRGRAHVTTLSRYWHSARNDRETAYAPSRPAAQRARTGQMPRPPGRRKYVPGQDAA